MEILRIEDLTFRYPLSDRTALNRLSLSVNEGDFTVICGATGSGKSTLLRLIKREIAPLGERSGRILYRNTPIDELSPKTAACSIGFVMQNPEMQLVTDKVWHELAFGLENTGLEQKAIARRVAEMASYFGIEDWYDRSVAELSGGQKQLLCLASVMVTDPDLLILDEPTAQLDPIAAADFLAALKKLRDDFGLTILMVEHRLEELIPLCDRLAVLEQGKLLACGEPRETVSSLRGRDELLIGMPTAVRLFHALSSEQGCPLTLREGRAFIEQHYDNRIRALPAAEYAHGSRPVLEFDKVCFRYARALPDVLHELSFTVYENEIFCILGSNGSGKTTALSLAAGLFKPYSGKVRVFSKKMKDYADGALYRECLALLPQDVQTVFLKNTVREELADLSADPSGFPFDLSSLLDKHPYDLSGGEQQLVALAKALAAKPKLLLADEPTKGLDAHKKSVFASVLKALKAKGMTVVVVTHDLEFASLCADRCALFFRGSIVSTDTPDRFFSDNRFYTTAASRMARGYFDRAVTVDDLAALCRLNEEKDGRA